MMSLPAVLPGPAANSSRILLFVATRRDAEVTQRLLTEAGLESTVCLSMPEVIAGIAGGAGALLLTEEALTADGAEQLIARLQVQEDWSDLPVVVMIKGGTESPRAAGMLRLLTNVTVLERPAPIRSMLSAVQAAVRARRRQYQIRDHMGAVRRAEALAQKLQQQLEAALRASDVGTFYVDLPPRELVCDERCRRHLSLSTSGPVAFQDALDAVHPDDRESFRQAAGAAITGQGQLEAEFRIAPAATPITRWIQVHGRVMRSPGAGTARFVGTTQDTTPRRKMQDERVELLHKEQQARHQAERANRLKDEFLATLSHELRTPLNAISGWAELLKEAPDDVDAVREAATAIQRNVNVQAELIEDLLDVSRIISGKVRLDRRPLQLAEVVQAAIETTRPVARAKGVQLETRLDLNLPMMTGDPARLQQMVWNLLSNAVKFTGADGTITVNLQAVAGHALITVSDTGEGIDAEFLPHLFERFSQADGSPSRRHGGLGLGLSIVKGLTKMHGGRVWATSKGKGEGSTFHLKLPLSPYGPKQPVGAPEVPTTLEREELSDRLKGLRVLVVDDQADAREVLQRLLQRRGAVPLVAGSAEEAWLMAERDEPQVIVSDIGMPDRDGYEFLRQLRRRNVQIPAIALTAFARKEDADRAYSAGYQAHLAKPVDSDKLLTLLVQLAGEELMPVP